MEGQEAIVRIPVVRRSIVLLLGLLLFSAVFAGPLHDAVEKGNIGGSTVQTGELKEAYSQDIHTWAR